MRASEGRRGGRARAVGVGVCAGLLSGVLIGLAFPPFGVWALALVGVLPVMAVAVRARRWGWAGVGVGVGSLPMWGVHHAWVWDVSALGMPGLAGYLGLWWAMFVWFVGAWRVVLGERVWAVGVLAGVVWVGLEWWRGEVVFHGYPWFYVVHPLIDLRGIGGLAGVVGQYGLGLLVALLGGLGVAAIAGVVRGGGRRWVGVGVAGALWAVGFGAARVGVGLEASALEALDGPRLRVGVVQTNVPQSNKTFWDAQAKVRDLEDFWAMTVRAVDGAEAGEALDVVVWPETMFPGWTLEAGAVERREEVGAALIGDGRGAEGEAVGFSSVLARGLVRAQGGLGAAMVVGAIGVDGYALEIDETSGELGERDSGVFNSVYVLEDGAVDAERYDKLALTPFGEVMPYVSAVGWLESLLLGLGASGMSFDLSAGRDARVLTVEPGEGSELGRGVRVATPVCFELTYGRVCRRLLFRDGARRAGVVFHLTNDGWFGGWRGGKEHHLLQARWRAAETRTPVVRAANTGVSAWIDAVGVVRERGVEERYVGWREDPGDGRVWRGEDRVGHNVGGVLRAGVTLGEGVPVSVRLGDWVGVGCGVVCVVGVVWFGGVGVGRRWRGRRGVVDGVVA